jgi:hypothetical protein
MATSTPILSIPNDQPNPMEVELKSKCHPHIHSHITTLSYPTLPYLAYYRLTTITAKLDGILQVIYNGNVIIVGLCFSHDSSWTLILLLIIHKYATIISCPTHHIYDADYAVVMVRWYALNKQMISEPNVTSVPSTLTGGPLSSSSLVAGGSSLATFRPPSVAGLVSGATTSATNNNNNIDPNDGGVEMVRPSSAQRNRDNIPNDGSGNGGGVGRGNNSGDVERKPLVDRGVRPRGTDVRLEQGVAFWEVERSDIFKYETLLGGIALFLFVVLFFICIIVVLTMD